MSGFKDAGLYQIIGDSAQPRVAVKKATPLRERRRAPRFGRVVYEAKLVVGGETRNEAVCVTDMSRSGAFVEGHHELAPGGLLSLILSLNDGEHLHVDARVVRHVTPQQAVSGGLLQGVGVEFVETPKQTLVRLEQSLLAANGA